MDAAAALPPGSASSPKRQGLRDITNGSPAPRNASATPKRAEAASARPREGRDDDDCESSDVVVRANDDGVGRDEASAADNEPIPPLPSLPGKPASNFYEILTDELFSSLAEEEEHAEVEDAAAGEDEGEDGTSPPAKKRDPSKLVVFEEALLPAKLIDDAVNKAAASRGASKKSRSSKNSAAAAPDAPPDAPKKKSWQKRARETDWTSSDSITSNFKKPTTKHLVPPQYMLSKITDVLLKAHAVMAWHKKLTIDQQRILRLQFFEMARKDRYDSERMEIVKNKMIKAARTKRKRKEKDKEYQKKRRDQGKGKKKKATAAKLVRAGLLICSFAAARCEADQSHLVSTRSNP